MALGDSPEMLRMQEEAVRRAREMYLRANPQQGTLPAAQPQRRQPESTRSAPVQQVVTRQEANPRAVPLSVSERTETAALPQTNAQNSPAAPANSILNTLMEDKDRTLILMMLVLLSGEAQSNELMFALLYLLI